MRSAAPSSDVSGSYNSVFVSFKRAGARTSLIVDPPNGRLPPLTPEAQKTAAAEREFRLALAAIDPDLQERGAWLPGLGNTIRRRRPRLTEMALRYNTARMNRNDGPEDSFARRSAA